MNLMKQPPKSWETAIAKLHSAWDSNRFPQVLLLEGVAGIGKRQLAMDIAAYICCESESLRPCGQCFSCKRSVDPGATSQWVLPLDTKERETPTKAAEATRQLLEAQLKNPYDLEMLSAVAIISVEQIRTLREHIQLKADRNRAFILTDADRMNTNAANALLKTLEEVPSQTYFILTTSARHRMLQTILSRSLPLVIPTLSDAEISGVFQQRALTQPTANIFGMAQGSVGRAMQCQALQLDDVVNQIKDFLEVLLQGKWSNALLEQYAWVGKELEQTLFYLEVLGTVLQDQHRGRAGVSLRLPSLQGWSMGNFDAEVIQKMVGACSQASQRLVQRKGTPSVVLPWLTIQLGELCHVR